MKQRTQFNYAQRCIIEQSGDKRSTQKRLQNVLLMMLIVVVGLGLLAIPWIWQLFLNQELAKVEAKIVYYQDVAETLADIERLQGTIAGMDNFREAVQAKAKDPRAVIAKVEKLLPPGATVSSFSLQADRSVQLGVIVAGPVDLAKLWISFRDSGYFTDFDLNAVALTDEVQRLSLTLKLN